MSTDEYKIRVTCDEDGTDVTLHLTPEQFDGVRALAAAVEQSVQEAGSGRYWIGPAIIVTSKNGVSEAPMAYLLRSPVGPVVDPNCYGSWE